MRPSATLTPVDPDGERRHDRDAVRKEATRTLAGEVGEVLTECGFTPGEIDRWVGAYTSRAGSGDADAFLDWISTYEHSWVSAMSFDERRCRR